MAGLAMGLRGRRCVVEKEARKVWWSAKQAMSAFYDQGGVLREEERSREAVYMKQREAEILEKLRKQGDKLEEIKRALAEYKEAHTSLTNWIHDTEVNKQRQN